MKKLASALLVCVMAFLFVGCGKNDITLSNEQSDLIAEYIAGTLLKYSYDNEWDYQKLNNSMNTYKGGSASNTGGAKDSTGQKQNGVNADSGSHGTTASSGKNNLAGTGNAQTSTDVFTALAEAYGLNGATISYKQAVVGERYPMGEYVICVPANQGCNVAAVEFTIRNNSASAITVNTSDSNVSMKLSVNGTSVVSYGTMLKNDLNKLNSVTIQPNEEYTAVVVFQIKKNLGDNISGGTLTINKGNSSIGTLTVN